MPLRFRKDILIYPVIIAALTILAYSATFEAPFIFDDAVNIVENSSLFGRSSFWEILSPPRGTGVAGRPIVNLTLALNHAISGENTWSYHLFNLAVHILAALLLFGILRRSLLFDGIPDACGAAAPSLAFACALLWALHPLQTGAVTYIIQRCESLMGLFFLATFYFAIRGWQSGSAARWHLAAIAAFLLGVGSKEVIVAAPFLLFLYDLVFVHRNPREVVKGAPLLYGGLLAGLLLLAVQVAAGGTSSSGTGNITFSPLDYWLTQPQVIIHYLTLSFWPSPLCIDYAWPVAPLAKGGPFLVAVALLLAATVYCLWWHPGIGFLLAWFFVILAPTSLMPLPDLAFDHRMYLPLAAVVVVTVSGVSRMLCAAAAKLSADSAKSSLIADKGARYLLILGGAALLILTFGRNLDYRSDVTLWAATVAQCPENSRAQVNLGSALVQHLRYREALAPLEESLAIEVKNARQYAAGRPEPEAKLADFYRYLSIRSVYAFARYNLGVAQLSLGKRDPAIGNFREALAVRPGYGSAHTTLGIALFLSGDREEAFRHFRRAVDLNPSDANALTNLGAACRLSGKGEEALAYLSRALALKPDNIEAHYGMGLTLTMLGRPQDAASHLKEAERLQRKRMAP
jgi:tetratricopeptide (TPR) repeat protein